MSSGAPRTSTTRPVTILRRLLADSSTGGIALMFAAALAILVANSPLSGAYFSAIGHYVGGLSVLHWVNDGLMAIFFLLVGLELKRELLDGQLSTWRGRILPGSAAVGGMVAPALIYLAFNRGSAGMPSGWAIAAATDIAFALGVLSLLGPRVPTSLKVFLTALAIIDDLGAILIIAIFYTGSVDAAALVAAGVVIAVLVALNRSGVGRLTPYLLLGLLLWFLVLRSGVHATIAGVALALTIPLRQSAATYTESPLHRLEHAITPWVALLIVPLFGFMNAGVSLAGLSAGALIEPVPLGVAAGLFLGKQLGVFVTAGLAIRSGWATLPPGATWRQLYGIAVLCGIGFTMSLFIGLLAFPEDLNVQSSVKLGVLLGSLLSALFGAYLIGVPPRARAPGGEADSNGSQQFSGEDDHAPGSPPGSWSSSAQGRHGKPVPRRAFRDSGASTHGRTCHGGS